jgi:hypothetical protein
VDKDIYFNYLQAYEGVCRDEFVFNESSMESADLEENLKKYRGFHTENFATACFD